MNINTFLLKEISGYLTEYNCQEEKIKAFMFFNGKFEHRQQEAVEIIKSIMKIHEKELLYEYVVELARIEQARRELQPWARDHVIHAIHSFLLGIYLNKKFRLPNMPEVNPFQWKIAGLFHDVGYPLQIATDALTKPFADQINKIKIELNSNRPDIEVSIKLKGLDKLANNINSLDLIQARLKQWDLRVDAKKHYSEMMETGDINHGIISSITILYVIDMIYQKFNENRVYKDILSPLGKANFNQKYFDGDVVSACSAIFIHDLPNSLFAKNKIDRFRAPVAFLLKLSDSLQEWERPSLNNKDGYPPDNFRFEISKEKMSFKADIDKEKKNKMKENISSLSGAKIEIP